MSVTRPEACARRLLSDSSSAIPVGCVCPMSLSPAARASYPPVSSPGPSARHLTYGVPVLTRRSPPGALSSSKLPVMDEPAVKVFTVTRVVASVYRVRKRSRLPVQLGLPFAGVLPLRQIYQLWSVPLAAHAAAPVRP